jgi:hypothetical protein
VTSVRHSADYEAITRPRFTAVTKRIAAALVLSLSVGGVHGGMLEEVRAAVRREGGPEQFVSRSAQLAAKDFPRMLDADTEGMMVSASRRTIHYYNRLVKVDKSQIEDLEKLRQEFINQNSPPVCTAPTASTLMKEYDVQYKYTMYSRSREYLFSYVLNRTTCRSMWDQRRE